ncbi:hypothetical protein [Pleionea sp. CnH1-48]|uniref:hypothetical protein n=1 Tax=Pleionea sp. CnH1-48 TaxID=2954494 RepID=UPI0020972658|nr:hypothetical protein [Pleionea sp. CnH1-48]MCO7224927.1 hypothetical protein [Pleionea sp. CnH1-48]
MKKIAFVFLFILISACKSSTTSNAVSQDVVHLIHPKDLAEYVENFKRLHAQLELKVDGQKQPFTFVDFDQEENVLIAQYSAGLLLIGFNFDSEELNGDLTLLEGDISDLENFMPDKLYYSESKDFVDGESAVYQRRLIEQGGEQSKDIYLVVNESFMEAGNSEWKVNGNRAELVGTLGTTTYIQLQQLLVEHPQLDTLVLKNIDGSINDAINLHTGRLVREHGLKTLMPADGEAYSGGVDLFASGVVRIYEKGGKLGVHAWCCVEGVPAERLGRNHSAHGAQLTYHREMLGSVKGPEFYFFTIEAAPFDGIHLMSEEQVNRYLLN